MPTLPLVLLAALFGVGAALLFVGVANGDLVALALGGVLVALGFRLRRQVQASLADDGAAPGADVGAEDVGTDHDAAEEGADQPSTATDGLVLDTVGPATSTTEDGETLQGSGCGLRDPKSGETVDGTGLRLSRDGAQVVRLVADADQPDELEADELAPGELLMLVPHRGRDSRVTGVRVFDEAIDHLAGWLPDDVAQRIGADALRRGELQARSFYEWRDAQGRRRQLDVLVHRSDALVDD